MILLNVLPKSRSAHLFCFFPLKAGCERDRRSDYNMRSSWNVLSRQTSISVPQKKQNPVLLSSLAGITPHRRELYKRCKAESNNLDVPPDDRSHWALTKPWRHLILHLSSSLQAISWARLESILGRSLPTQTDRRTLKYDGWREREHKPLSTERDSIYTSNISGERQLVGGAETEHFCEPMQTDVGQRRRHFHSQTGMSALPVEWARRFLGARAYSNV